MPLARAPLHSVAAAAAAVAGGLRKQAEKGDSKNQTLLFSLKKKKKDATTLIHNLQEAYLPVVTKEFEDTTLKNLFFGL